MAKAAAKSVHRQQGTQSQAPLLQAKVDQVPESQLVQLCEAIAEKEEDLQYPETKSETAK